MSTLIDGSSADLRSVRRAAPEFERRPATPAATAHAAALALGAAAIVGVLAENVLRAGPPGAGITLAFVVLVAATGLLAYRTGPVPPGRLWAFLPPLLFAVALSWRASGMLTFLNGVACVLSLALAARTLVGPRSWVMPRAGVRDYAGAVLHSAIQAGVGVPPLVALAGPAGVRTAAVRRFTVLTVRALTLAAVPLLVFGALLTSADPIFSGLADRVLSVDLSATFAHNAVAAIFAWITAGYLYGALFASRAIAVPRIPARPRLNLADVSVTLGALDLLFLAFVLVQLRYLFGGAELVVRTAGMTYAEYARRGFFELVGVTALALPLLLAMHAFLPRHRDGAPVRRAYRWLAGALLACLGVVVLSALRRMHLYQAQYGLTELRLYATAFMLWIAAVLALFAATVLRDRPRGFAFGWLAGAWALVAALNVANPDALIVRTNVARVHHARELDALYLRQLSADAAPALRGVLPTLAPWDQCSVAQALGQGLGTRSPGVGGDWRSWNAGRERAWRIAREVSTSEAAACGVARPAVY